MWRQFWEEHLPSFKFKGWQAEVFSDASLQPSASEAFSFDCVYDAVWATAIGLAAAALNDEIDKVEKWSRNGGGKGAFQGASGLVSFDEKGERDSFGLVYTLENLQGPALSTTQSSTSRRHDDHFHSWQGFVFTDHWRILGTFEESHGFIKSSEGVKPYWPGGLRGWSAPPDRFKDEEARETPAPITVVKEVEVYVERASWGLNDTLAVSVPAGLCFLLLIFVSYRLWRHTELDQAEESMRVSTKELRQILQITHEQGYILSTERRGVWRRFGKYVIIPKVQMEAAVRLWRREDFDVDAFDALCVLIADNEYHADANDPKPSATHGAGLKHAAHLGASEGAQETVVNASTGFALPTEVANRQNGSPGADLEGGHISGRASHTPFLESGQRPDQLRLLRQWVLEQASATVAELSSGNLPQTTIMGQRRLSRPQLYRYLCRKLMQVRIFRDTSCSLFKELKVHVQAFMNQLAGLCNDR